MGLGCGPTDTCGDRLINKPELEWDFSRVTLDQFNFLITTELASFENEMLRVENCYFQNNMEANYYSLCMK